MNRNLAVTVLPADGFYYRPHTITNLYVCWVVSASLKGYGLGSRNVVTVTVIVADIVTWNTPSIYQWRRSLWGQNENLCTTLRVAASAVTVTHVLCC